MNSLAHALLLIVVFVSLALLGQVLVNRFVKREVLEVHHSAGEAMMGVVGTLFSVLLGFMVASAMDKYNDARMHDELEASNVASVFRVARGLSDIDRPRIRQLCREYVDDVINSEWPKMEQGVKINHGWETYQKLWEAVVATVPENDRQSNLQQGLIASMQSLGENRRARILLAQTGLQASLWLIVGFGAVITVLLSYVFASQFPKVQGFMTTLVATALALNIWLLSAYSHPYTGELRIRPNMFELLKENVLNVPDAPSRYLHDAK
ncbi:MAG: DUF4239 domain-containing protein [Candidatus Obscuribacter phosphatis]|uniref:DUF4239 domain-containing protein n=1 Tax=Candidatus Obscuribacter phosphatis TaxID=1906157 RepID=A0A8J7PKX4_9BACT|nr:DUF4239 domain-containing protein [Candidatus Obscuribacter phosphatis]